MKRILALLTIAVVMISVLFSGCGGEISGQGFRLIDDDGTYVTYRLKCTSCGHIYDQDHMYPLYEGADFTADILCDYCGQNIHLSIRRK